MSVDVDLLVRAGVRRTYAERLLVAVGSGRALATLTASELTAAGVPEATAYRIEAAIALGRRSVEGPRPTAITQPADAWRALAPLVAGLNQEVFWVINLDIRNQMIGAPVEVARGSVCGVEVHPREVFRAAVRVSAAGIVLAHNHPSGDPTPSQEDITLTRRLREVGALMGIPVVDHIVVCADRFHSIGEQMGASL